MSSDPRDSPLVRLIQGFEDQQRDEPFPLQKQDPLIALKFSEIAQEKAHQA